MKIYLVSFIFFFSFFVSAQDCSFKDSVFASILKTQNLNDSRLQVYSFDTISKLNKKIILDQDKNGLISLEEAKSIHSLYLAGDSSNFIKSIHGIGCFSNITKLALTGLYADSIEITNQKLINLHVINNPGCKYLNASNTSIDTLILASNKNLSKINLINCLNLKVIDCSNNSTLNSIDVFNCPNLIVFSSINSALVALDLSANFKLKTLIVKNNAIKKINTNSNKLLQILVVDDNPIDSVYLLNLNYLSIFSCNNSQIKELDFSSNYKLKTLDVGNNPFLYKLNLKNGSKLNDIYLSNLPNLKYICSDEVNKNMILDSLTVNGMYKVEINSYCSDKPGGHTNTFSGKITFDADANGCDVNDNTRIMYSKFLLNDSQQTKYSFTNSLNKTDFYVSKGYHTIKPLIDSNFFISTPKLITHTFIDSFNQDTLVNFCITKKNNFKDVEVLIVPSNKAIIGDSVTYMVFIRNKAAVATNGTIHFLFNDSLVKYQNSDSFNLVTKNELIANFNLLLPFESRSYIVSFLVKKSNEAPSIAIGDSLRYTAKIDIPGIDVFSEDNTNRFVHIISEADRSNFMLCLNGNLLNSVNYKLPIDYVIDFDDKLNNEKILIVQNIDTSHFDLASCQILHVSSPSKIEIVGNQINYYIDNKSGEHKHGNILLRYQELKSHNVDDSIIQRADLYFGDTTHCSTNDEMIVFRNKLLAELKSNQIDNSVEFFPNPTNSKLFIQSNSKLYSVDIYTLNGSFVCSLKGMESKVELDVSGFKSGLYYVKIITSKGANVREFIKADY